MNSHPHDHILKSQYLLKSAGDIAQQIGKSKSYVINRMKILGLKVPMELSRKFAKKKALGRTSFTQEMDEYIINNYLKIPIKELARHLGKSSPGVRYRMTVLGLKVPRDVTLSRKRASQFKKGHTSHNKGKKATDFMTPEQYEAFKKNQFKKGNVPHNHKKIGTIVKSKQKSGIVYLVIKTSEDQWEFLNRYNYQKYIGPIGEKEVITFIDGNSENCDPKNLKKITMSENMINNGLYTYGPEVAQAKLLLSKIKKELNLK